MKTQDNEDTGTTVATVAHFENEDDNLIGVGEKILSIENPFLSKGITKNETKLINSIGNIEKCFLTQNKTDPEMKSGIEIDREKIGLLDSYDACTSINAQNIQTIEKVQVDSHNNEGVVGKSDKYYHDSQPQNSQFSLNQDSYFLESSPVVLSNKDNTPDILMDTKEKEHLKQNLNVITPDYHCKEDYQQILSKKKSNLLLLSEPSSTSSLDFITISEWNEEEEEERRLRHLTKNTSKTSFSCTGNRENGFTSSDRRNKDDEEALKRRNEVMQDAAEDGNYTQKIVEKVDENNELRDNNKGTLSPNYSLESASQKGKYNMKVNKLSYNIASYSR